MDKNKSFLDGLTPQEEDFMRALWSIGEGEIKDAIEKMEGKDTPYTTIASTVAKLETKGYIKRIGKNRGFVYAPIITEEDYYNHTLKYVVSNFFTGSYKNLIQYFAEEEKLSKAEIREILDLIEEE